MRGRRPGYSAVTSPHFSSNGSLPTNIRSEKEGNRRPVVLRENCGLCKAG